MPTNNLTLTEEQKNNVEYIIKRMGELGLTNAYIQAGILAVISKESSFIPKSERSYSGTSNSRIRQIFGHRVSGLTDDQLTAIKNDPEQFFNKIYGGRYGNALDEGYKYRGRGLNQLTFKTNYININPYTTKDIVVDPDSLNQIPTATEAAIGFFKRAFGRPNAKLSLYNMDDVNDAKNTTDAVGVAFHANTGWGKSKTEIERDRTGGYAKALARVDQFYEMTKKATVPGKETSKDESAAATVLASGDVTANVLNVRTGPGTNYSTDGSIKRGTTVHVYKKEGRWLKISATEEKWVHGNYVNEGTIAPPAPTIIASGTVSASVLNIRKGPGTNFDKLGSFSRGETVHVYKKEGRWLKINPTEEQWVHGNYVNE
jgi:uncharacterized protein YraI/predicted chitinase